MSRVAVVTGGASGIGLGVAQQLAADGHRVAVLDRNGAGRRGGGRRARGRGRHGARRRGRRRRPGVGRRRRSPGSAPSSARSRSSSRARASSRSTRSLDITAETWDRIIAVNLTGTFTCVQAAVPDMLAAGWGRIVTISSSSAQSGAPNMAHYAASKGGVIALTKALAVELARSGITVNTIPPSLVDTPMARAGRSRRRLPRRRRRRPDGPARPGRHPRRHRRRLLVPLLRRRQLHHRPGHRRQRRHVHLTRNNLAARWPVTRRRRRGALRARTGAGSARRVRAGCRRTSGGRSGTGTARPSSRR